MEGDILELLTLEGFLTDNWIMWVHLWELVKWPQLGRILVHLLNTLCVNQATALEVNNKTEPLEGIWNPLLRWQSLTTGLLMKSSSCVTLVGMAPLKHLWGSISTATWIWCPVLAETQNPRCLSWTHLLLNCACWYVSFSSCEVSLSHVL